jgi:flagellar assembly factor FliW
MNLDSKEIPPDSASFTIATGNLGQITVREGEVITFSPGLPGWSQFHRYVLVERPEESPFLWLQCVDNPDLALVVIDPAEVVAQYQVAASSAFLIELGVEGLPDLRVLVILTIPPGRPREMTANLAAPLLINLRDRRGRQVVLEDPKYSRQHRVLPR